MKGGTEIKPAYDISSPIFDEITIHLDPDYYPGKSFTISTENNSLKNKYIQSVQLNGKNLDQSWFYHTDLIKGGNFFSVNRLKSFFVLKENNLEENYLFIAAKKALSSWDEIIPVLLIKNSLYGVNFKFYNYKTVDSSVAGK